MRLGSSGVTPIASGPGVSKAKCDSMEKISAANGALAIMMGAGAIADFQVIETGSEILVRVWPQQPGDDARLRKQVAAILPAELDEHHVVVIE